MNSVFIKRLLTSCLGLGWMPIAPGTWGSIPPVVLFVALNIFNVPVVITAILLFVLVTDFSTFCVMFSPASIEATGRKDPGEVVADEVAGQSLVFLIVSFVSFENFYIAGLAGFLCFRFFDITKIWPACALEKLPAGWGILLDDLAAGIYAGLVMLVLNSIGII